MDLITVGITIFINKGAKTSYSSYYGNIGWQRLITEMDYVGQNVTLLKLQDLAALAHTGEKKRSVLCVCACLSYIVRTKCPHKDSKT